MKAIKKRAIATWMLTLVALILCAWAVYGQERTQPASPLRTRTKQARIIAQLEKSIPSLMKDGDVPGLAVALVRNGELAWHRGFGVKSVRTNEPVNDDKVFEAASLSKPVFIALPLWNSDFDRNRRGNHFLTVPS
jgi:CubicO group peptidase (beta-lactamase class C family)